MNADTALLRERTGEDDYSAKPVQNVA